MALKTKLTDTQKIKSIHYLLDECSRSNEFVEQALLYKIEEIINDDVDDKPETLNKLIREAEHES